MWQAAGAAASTAVLHSPRTPPLAAQPSGRTAAALSRRPGRYASAAPTAGSMVGSNRYTAATAARSALFRRQQQQLWRPRSQRRPLAAASGSSGPMGPSAAAAEQAEAAAAAAAAEQVAGSQGAVSSQPPAAAAAPVGVAAAAQGEAAAAAAAGQQQQQAAAAAAAGASLSLTDLWMLLRHDRRQLTLCVAFTALSVACAVTVAPSLGAVVDIISKGTAATAAELAVAVGRLGAVYIISNVSLAVQVALSLALGESMAHRLRCRLFGALLSRDTLFFDRVKTGQMVAWLGQDIEVLQSTVAKLLGARGIRSVFETVGIIIVLFTLSWPLALVLLVSAPLLTPLIASLSTRIGAASKASQAAAGEVSAAADEIVDNVRVVKLFAQQQNELRRFQGLLEVAHQLTLKVLRLQGLLDASSRVRNTLCVLSTLGLGAYMALNNTVSIGTCYSFFVFSFSFAFALGNLTNTAGDVARAAGAINRAMQTMQQAFGSSTPAAALAAAAAADDAASAQAGSSGGVGGGSDADPHQQQHHGRRRLADVSWQGGIEFKGVSFRHPGWTGWTLNEVSFSIPAGQTVALVGPSGGGKSTIASMLMGLYEPAEGGILVDGQPLSELDLKWWRRQLGVVMQDPGLLTGRVADVIRYSQPGASDADVEWAARTAQADGFIAQLPHGYQTSIGSGSSMELSGGQRQRLAIARALLSRPRVLILDEATSALDVETEQGVTAELETAGTGVTSLIIAHRLSTVRRADSIVVVDGGRVVERGTHKELMQRQGGVYYNLVSSAERQGQDCWDRLQQSAAGAAAGVQSGDSSSGGGGDGQLNHRLVTAV